MSQNQTSFDREKLNFIQKTKEAFKFLEDFGYKVINEDVTFICYRGSLGFVNIYHGRYSFEIGIEFGQLEELKDPPLYTLEDLIWITDSDVAQKYFKPSANEPMMIEKLLKEQAELFRRYGEKIFNNNAEVWSLLKKNKKSRIDEYWKNIQLSQVRKEAEQAFHEHRYQDFIQHLSPWIEDLLPGEKKKFDFAKKKTQAD